MTRALLLGAVIVGIIGVFAILHAAGKLDSTFTANDLRIANGWHVDTYATGFAQPTAITTGDDGTIVFVLANETVYALRDVNNDGRSDLRFAFARAPNDADIAVFLGDLYVRSSTGITRYPEAEGHIALGASPVAAATFPERPTTLGSSPVLIADASIQYKDQTILRGWRTLFTRDREPLALATSAHSVYVLDSEGSVWLLQRTID